MKAHVRRLWEVALVGCLTGGAAFPAGSAVLDIDHDGTVEAATDGRLLLRYQFGFRGQALVTGALGSGVSLIEDPEEIAAYLASVAEELDIDLDTANRPLSDGLLVLRRLHGFTGGALTDGVVAPGAARSDPGEIAAHIADLLPNTPPVARDDAFTTPDCAPITGNVLENNGNGADSDADGHPLSIQTVPVVAPAGGELVLQANGDFTYTPPADFIADSFVYRVGDMHMGNATATVSLSVAPGYPLDCVLRFDHLQAKGTKNSFHTAPAVAQDPSHAYTQPSLTDQLALHGVRQFEIDVHRRVVGESSRFEVFHLPAIDPGTTCQIFTDCLAEIREWSDANPAHLPLMIWIEPKDDIDDDLPPELAQLGYTQEDIDPGDTLRRFDDCFACYEELEAEILSVFPRGRIFAPDDLRGTHADLPSALAADGWPPLGRLRGKVVFALLDDTDLGEGERPHRGTYLAPSAILAGRLLFVDGSNATGETALPFAALFKVNRADDESARVTSLVSGGFMVTANLDEVTDTAATNQARVDASLAAGIHFGSTHYPTPVDGVDYSFNPVWEPARCNPLSQPEIALPGEGCTPAAIEELAPAGP